MSDSPVVQKALDVNILMENLNDIARFTIEKNEYLEDNKLSEEELEVTHGIILKALQDLIVMRRSAEKEFRSEVRDSFNRILDEISKEAGHG